MSEEEARLDAAELAREFDEAFARARITAEEESVAVVLLGAGSRRLAVPVLETRGVARAGKLIAMPRPSPWLVGLTAIEGQLVPVIGAGRILGDAPADGEARWLVRIEAGEPVAIGFSAFEGFALVPGAALVRHADQGGEAYIGAIVLAGAERRGVLDVSAIADKVRSWS